MSSPHDSALIQACIAGDAAAWRELVNTYTRLVYSIARKTGLSEADADDAHAAVWTIVYRSLPRLQDQSRFSSWLITTTNRECWRVARSRMMAIAGGSPMAEELAAEPLRQDQLESMELQHLVRQGLNELGSPCRELLEALYCARTEPSYEQIAERLGMKVGSIGPTRARCLQKLQNCLERLGLDESAVGIR